jgi:hypothetical protein
MRRLQHIKLEHPGVVNAKNFVARDCADNERRFFSAEVCDLNVSSDRVPGCHPHLVESTIPVRPIALNVGDELWHWKWEHHDRLPESQAKALPTQTPHKLKPKWLGGY